MEKLVLLGDLLIGIGFGAFFLILIFAIVDRLEGNDDQR